MKTKERQSNIELLRIVAIIGVIVLHYNNKEMGGAFGYVVPGSVNQMILLVLESLFACGVNVFVLITGYFMCQSDKRTWIKPFQLVLQVMIYGAGMYVVRAILFRDGFHILDFLKTLVPSNWFVVLYVVLYLISPYLNKMLRDTDGQGRKRMLMICLALFSMWPFFVDVFEIVTKQSWMGLNSVGLLGDQAGYTIINFALMYLIGGYIRMNEEVQKDVSTISWVVTLFVLIGVISLLSTWDEGIAWSYCSPLIIAEAVVLFMLFKKIGINTNRIINRLSAAAFSVYLLHSYFLPHIRIEEYVQKSPWAMLLHIAISVSVIYIISWIAHEIYSLVMRIIWK